jgi:Ca2+/H+ antiporter, TMEM165/GDT1 family
VVLDLLAGAVPAFLASLVEFVEALTIVLAVGASRSWRAAAAGAIAATAVLVVVIIGFGPTLLDRIDPRVLLLVIGVLLLLFGGRWLRKAILRAAGFIPLHDEAAAYAAEVGALGGGGSARRFDWLGFAVSFKGVFLEGIEVVFIVLALGAAGAGYGAPAVGAGGALLLVIVAGAALRRPLTRVPENTLKFAVGVMLVTFGVYWVAEGLGVTWAGGATALVYLLAATLALAVVAVRLLRGATHPAVGS